MSGIVARQLVIGRGSFRAGPFDLAAPAGAVTALIGPNGGGKSTLLRTLAGLLPAVAGIIGRDGSAALLPAPGALTAPFSAAHMVTLGRAGRSTWRPHLGAHDRAAAEAALASLGIADLGARPFDRLSSGQQQLVLVARLIAQGAQACLLDEPTATLDPARAAAVERAIAILAAEGRAVILATHDLGLAMRADQVVTVGADRTAGPPVDVLTPERVAALYGTALSPCTTCGQPAAFATRA